MDAVINSRNGSPAIEDYLHEGLLALIPFYSGDLKSVILTSKGRHPDKRSVPWLVKCIARHYRMDIDLVKQHSEKLLKIRNNFSLVFTEHLVLMPVTMRRVSKTSETGTGYISLDEVKRFRRHLKTENEINPYRSKILLHNGQELLTFNMLRTLHRRKDQAETVKADYLKLMVKSSTNGSGKMNELLDKLPECNCLLLDMFLSSLGIDNKPETLGEVVSFPTNTSRFAPELLRMEPGENIQSI